MPIGGAGAFAIPSPDSKDNQQFVPNIGAIAAGRVGGHQGGVGERNARSSSVGLDKTNVGSLKMTNAKSAHRAGAHRFFTHFPSKCVMVTGNGTHVQGMPLLCLLIHAL